MDLFTWINTQKQLIEKLGHLRYIKLWKLLLIFNYRGLNKQEKEKLLI